MFFNHAFLLCSGKIKMNVKYVLAQVYCRHTQGSDTRLDTVLFKLHHWEISTVFTSRRGRLSLPVVPHTNHFTPSPSNRWGRFLYLSKHLICEGLIQNLLTLVKYRRTRSYFYIGLFPLIVGVDLSSCDFF